MSDTRFICTETDPITGECTDEYEGEQNEETKGFILWNFPNLAELIGE